MKTRTIEEIKDIFEERGIVTWMIPDLYTLIKEANMDLKNDSIYFDEEYFVNKIFQLPAQCRAEFLRDRERVFKKYIDFLIDQFSMIIFRTRYLLILKISF